MFLPILHYDDGYGFTYGMRISFVDRLGPRSRITVPLSWGGERQARVQVERTFKPRAGRSCGRRVRHRPQGEPALRNRRHAHVVQRPRRRRACSVGCATAWAAAWTTSSSAMCKTGSSASVPTSRIDTRVDPAFPRNAVHAEFGWNGCRSTQGRPIATPWTCAATSGLFGRTVLAVRGLSITSDQPLPAYEQNLLGGPSSLRGFDAGYQGRRQHRGGVGRAAHSADVAAVDRAVRREGLRRRRRGLSERRASSPTRSSTLATGGGVYLHLTLSAWSLDVAKAQDRRLALALRHGGDVQMMQSAELRVTELELSS